MRPGQQGIPGWELAALGNVLDEPQVHRHVAVAALTGVQRAVYLVQHMGVQQVQRHGQHRQQAEPHRAAVGVPSKTDMSAPGKNQYRAKQGGPGSRKPDGPQREAAHQREPGGQRRQQRNTKPAPQRDRHGRGAVRHGPPCQQQPGGQKQRQIRDTDKHHTPSRSKGGVYSSRALLFSCM